MPIKSAVLIFVACLMPWLAAFPAKAETWYVRGGVGYEKSADANFSDANCASTNPPALFGCGTGADGKLIGAYGDFRHGRSFEVAAGVRWSPLWRADVALTRRSNLQYAGNANFLVVGSWQPVAGKAESTTAMLNFYLDLVALTGKEPGMVRPYVGLGVGMSRNHLGALTFQFPQNAGRHKSSVTPRGGRTDFAYSVMLGAEFVLGKQTFLDTSLRYSHLGKIGSDRGGMSMNHVANPILIDEFKTRLRSYGLAVGIRYEFR